MDKKILTGILAVLVIVSSLVVVRFLSPEDNWICVNGEWVKHGNPSSEKPAEDCSNGKNLQDADKNIEVNYAVYFSNNKLDPEVSCIKVFPVFISAINSEGIDLKKILEVLLQGVAEKEKADGYYSSIPENVKINSISRSGNAVTIDFSKDIEKNSGGSCRVGAIRAQIYWTVINFDKSVRSVNIAVEGETETALQP
jgi:spore germination protein GerM